MSKTIEVAGKEALIGNMYYFKTDYDNSLQVGIARFEGMYSPTEHNRLCDTGSVSWIEGVNGEELEAWLPVAQDEWCVVSNHEDFANPCLTQFDCYDTHEELFHDLNGNKWKFCKEIEIEDLKDIHEGLYPVAIHNRDWQEKWLKDMEDRGLLFTEQVMAEKTELHKKLAKQHRQAIIKSLEPITERLIDIEERIKK